MSILKMSFTALILMIVVVTTGCLNSPNDRSKSGGSDIDAAIPEAAYEYTLADYQVMFREEMLKIPALAKSLGEDGMPPLTLNEIAELDSGVSLDIPNFNDIESEQELQALEKNLNADRDFIAQNADSIRKHRIAGHRYLLFKKIVDHARDIDSLALRKRAGYSELNSAEKSLLFWNPTFIDGTHHAINEAFRAEVAFFGSNTGDTKGDAFRHTVWNHMLADYNSHEVNYESEAVDWARRYSNAHESTSDQAALATNMDYHNNARGREYFLSVSKNRGKVSWWGYDSRWVETEPSSIARANIYIKSQNAVKFTANNQLSALIAGLVYLQ